MLSKIQSLGCRGVTGYAVSVECHVSNGLPGFDIVGLPDAAVKEARERVRSAIKTNGMKFPVSRLTVNLAPADTRKAGTLYDLPVLLGILCATGEIRQPPATAAFLGEVSLAGEVRPVTGALTMALAAEQIGLKELYVPAGNAAEAAFADRVTVYPVENIAQLVHHLRGDRRIAPKTAPRLETEPRFPVDFAEVKAQENVKRALEVAAAGGHNILLIGPPGAGKSMLAKRLPTILPAMNRAEMIETTQVYSVLGLTTPDDPVVRTRPFRAPHHTVSNVAMSGGGSALQPGEMSLANNGTIATKTTATSVSWTPALSLASQIPNATSGTCTITCTTYNGNTNIGSKTCTLGLSVPASVKPTISSLTASRIDGEVPSAWGIYVQTKSKVKLTINGAAGSYGSTIKSYSITGGGYSGSASTLTTGFLNNSGTITFKATVTDSRGRVSAEASVSITVTAYSPPYFNSSLSQRCLSNGTLDDDGTYIHALVSFGYSTCGGKNTLKTSVQYKQVSAEQWTDAGVIFTADIAFTYGNGQISTETSYDVRYTLEDAFSNISVQEIVSTAAVVMDFKSGGKGVAIGKVSERDNTFEVAENWDVKVYGMLLKEYIQQFAKTMYPVGSIYLSVSPTNPSTYFGGTWVAWGSGRVPVGINTSDSNFNTVEKTGGASAVTLTASQMPSHTHTFTGSSTTTNSAGGHTHNVGWDADGGGGTSRYTVHKAGTSGAQGTSPTSNSGAHTHTLTPKGKNGNTGGGGSHTNLQPYIVCYMWKRTA